MEDETGPAMLNTDQPVRCVFLPYGEGNPYPDLLASHLAAHGVVVSRPHCGAWFFGALRVPEKTDILHLHWLGVFYRADNVVTVFLKICVFLLQISMAKWAGIRIVWTVHNLDDHESGQRRLETMCRRNVARMADAIIVHNQWSREEVVSRYGKDIGVKTHRIPHGSYLSSYPQEVDPAVARMKFGLPETAFVFLFFGAIRPYKGAEDLLSVWAGLDHPGASLLIAGRPLNNVYAQRIDRLARGQDDVILHQTFIEADDLASYFAASDVVVFPFRRITTSGSLILAMTLGKACIAPRIGPVQEELGEHGGYLYDPGEPEGLARAMDKAMRGRDRIEEMGLANRERITERDWRSIAHETRSVYVGEPSGE